MLRTKPTLTYSGLTVIVSNSSRMDHTQLCSGNGGVFFNAHCLRPELNEMMVDFRVMEDESTFLPGTKAVLLMGEAAMHKWCSDTRGNTLNEMRGSPLNVRGLPAVASYFYQDCVDFKDHESRLNKLSKNYEDPEDEDYRGGDGDEAEGDVKRFGNTSRSNYAFWLRADVRKLKAAIQNGGHWPTRKYPEPVYKVYPSSEEVINVLTNARNVWLELDLETDYVKGNPHCRNVLCFSFSVDNGLTVYCVPVLTNEYTPAYSSIHLILRALAVCMSRNTTVAHNGAAFDFPVLALKLGLGIGKVFDTLIAAHRIYPNIEKSLGHWVSLLLNERFHKDENPGVYRTYDDMMRMLRYCGKDVYTMSCIRQEQLALASRIPGLRESIDCAMDSIRPYMVCSLQGIRYDETMRQGKIKENDRLMGQYLRMITLLIGETAMEEIQSVIKSKKKGALPSSNPQACKYFHGMLGYKTQQLGRPNQQTGVRNPSLAAKSMYKLRLEYDNPVIELCIAYRGTKLETTTPLGFLAWKDDNNKTPLPEGYDSPLISTTNPSNLPQEQTPRT